VPDYSVVPRRSTRLVDKPRASNPEVQATNVMLKKLGKYVPPPTTVDSGARRSTKRSSAPVTIHEGGHERAVLGTQAFCCAARRRVAAPLPRRNPRSQNLSSCSLLYVPRSSLLQGYLCSAVVCRSYSRPSGVLLCNKNLYSFLIVYMQCMFTKKKLSMIDLS
jgi:hypothetical protein